MRRFKLFEFMKQYSSLENQSVEASDKLVKLEILLSTSLQDFSTP